MKTFRTTRFIADRVIILDDECYLSNGCQFVDIEKHNVFDMMRKLPIEVCIKSDLVDKTKFITFNPINAKVEGATYKVDYER